MLYDDIVHDAAHSSRSYQDPYGFCPRDPQAERILSVCLSVAQTLTSKYQSRTNDRTQIDCTSDMICVLEDVARNNDIVLYEGSMRLRPE